MNTTSLPRSRRITPRLRPERAGLSCLLLAAVLAPLGTPALGTLASPGVSAAHADVPQATRTPAALPASHHVVPRAAWTPPIGGRLHVAHGFSAPAEPWGPGHRGVDLRAPAGEVVRAAGAGVVVYAGRVATRGVVSVQHGATLRTTYEPLAPLVRQGQQVRAGQPVGLLTREWSHCAPDPCLHWGLRNGETYLNPLALLHRLPVRLLPVWGVPEPSPDRSA